MILKNGIHEIGIFRFLQEFTVDSGMSENIYVYCL